MMRHLNRVRKEVMADVEDLAAQPWTPAVGPEGVTVERATRLGNTYKKDGLASFEVRPERDGATLICTTGHLQQWTGSQQGNATQAAAETSLERKSADVEMVEGTEAHGQAGNSRCHEDLPSMGSRPIPDTK